MPFDNAYKCHSSYCWYFPGEMLDEVTAVVDGYSAYFSFSKVKTGYSGEAEVKVFDFVALLNYQLLKDWDFFLLEDTVTP